MPGTAESWKSTLLPALEDSSLTYKLIALDLDGTLMSHDLRISPRVRRAIRRAKDKGIIVSLASGRAIDPMLPYVVDLGASGPVIGYQGCEIVLPETREVIYRATIPLPEAHALLEYAQSLDLDATVYVDDNIYLREFRHPQEFYDRWFGLPCILVDDLVASVRQRPTKVIIIGEGPENDRLMPELERRFGSLFSIVRSHTFFVEGMPLGVSKGTALERVAADLGIPQEQTLAIGDAGNDIEMIAWAGLGVAMGNAMEEVKAVADYIAPSVEEDGAAVAIETFCLNEEEVGSL